MDYSKSLLLQDSADNPAYLSRPVDLLHRIHAHPSAADSGTSLPPFVLDRLYRSTPLSEHHWLDLRCRNDPYKSDTSPPPLPTLVWQIREQS